VQSHSSVFRARRERLAKLRLSELRKGEKTPVILASGWARPRNFAHNVYPFRAESHFLYFVGAHIEGALLSLSGSSACLFMEPPDPEMELWMGRAKTLSEWSEQLGLPVRPLEEFTLDVEPACIPPQDEETASWMAALLERPVDAQLGPDLEGADADLGAQIIECRLFHDDGAVAQLELAAEGSAAAHRAGMRATRHATREREVRGAMEGALVAAGLCPGYTPIVTTHGEILHAERSDGALTSGQLLLCDVGGETREGWNADITRTWPVNGEFSPTQRDVYQAVLDVQERAIEGVRVGVDYAELHLQALRHMAESLVDLGILKGTTDALVETGAASVFFPHGLGHLLGLDVHDMEDLGDAAGYAPGQKRSAHPTLSTLRLRRVLKENMYVTIEPGFYQVPLLLERAKADASVRQFVDWSRLEAFSDVRGIRIEDDVLVGEKGPRVLSASAPKEIAEIEALLAE
jgi:Xaa-Pro aminopeptidase